MLSPESPVDPTAVLAEAREALASGEHIDRALFVARIRATSAPEQAEAAVAQLDHVLAVGRARARLSKEKELSEAPPRSRPLWAAVKNRPILTANMEVRRVEKDATYALAWDVTPGVVDWEIRLAERSNPRGEYVSLETRTLAPETTTIELPLTERALRIHLIGRGRGGKLLRRAVISGLSRENWSTPWQKRASAA